MSDNNFVLKDLLNHSKELSKEKLKSHFLGVNIGEIQILEEAKAKSNDHYWMALIVIRGQSMKLTFKTFFNTHTLQNDVSKVYRIHPEEITRHNCMDFMKEYCNLFAGGIKLIFSHNEIKTRLGLPIVARMQDDKPIVASGKLNVEESAWTLKFGEFNIICQTIIQTNNDAVFNNFKIEQIEDSGDVDFF